MKKFSLIIVLLFGLFMLSACDKSEKLYNVDNIKKENIFNQKEDSYFVYFHRVECQDCEQVATTIIEYATIVKEYSSCQQKRKIYSVLLYTKAEKPKDGNLIYREYTGVDGQGTDGKYFVNGVTNWEDLYIASTSSLIAITTNKNGDKVASYQAQGAEAVAEKLIGQLGECYNN